MPLQGRAAPALTRTALALSPHLDDAAFSCGGTLATLAASGWRVVVATLFTASVPDPQGFALACQLDKGLGPVVDYMALRRDEDAEAMRCLGVGLPVHLPFREAPHRGYGSAAALFGPTRPDDTVGDALTDAVRELIHAHRPDLLLMPQAIGGHVDHVQLVHATERAVEPAMPVLRWFDFPYLMRDPSPAAPFGAMLDKLPLREVALGPEAARGKRDACLAYASQIGFQFGGSAGLDGRLAAAGPVEFFRAMNMTAKSTPTCLRDPRAAVKVPQEPARLASTGEDA